LEGTHTIVYTALEDLNPTPPLEPGIKQMHLILNGFKNPPPGQYQIEVTAETGPGGTVERGVGFIQIHPKIRPSINVTSVFNDGTPNTIFQETTPGTQTPLLYDFLLWDQRGNAFEGVSFSPGQPRGGESYIVQADDWLSKLADKFYGDILAYPAIWQATNAKAVGDDSFAMIEDPDLIELGQKLWIPAEHGQLVKDGQVIGHIFIEAPAGVTGHNVSIVDPSLLINAPVSGLPTARLTAAFTPAEPGQYAVIFSLNGGNTVQTFVRVN
jgi:hypothetical protein